jgi:hypothetical protein
MSSTDKPLNIFAAVFLVAGLIFLLVDPVWTLIWMRKQEAAEVASATFSHASLSALSVEQTWLVARNAVIGAGGLIAYGVIIEILDGLRWRATPMDERPAMRWRYVLRRLDGLRPSMANVRAWPDRPKA